MAMCLPASLNFKEDYMKSLIFLSLILYFFYAELLLKAHDQHDGLRHWEIPSQDPDRIILTFHGDPSTSRAVTWRTDKTITKAVAQIAEATVNSKFTSDDIEIDAATEAFDLGQYKRNSSLIVHYHSVRFQDIRMAYQTAPNASFAIHAGDLVNTAHRDHEWAQWFKAGGFLHSQWTAIPAVGNHEFSSVNGGSRRVSIQWRPQFTLPVEKSLDPELHETVYSVDYQDVRIIVLNSNENLEQQTEYLEAQLKNCTAKWKIVTCHHSIFSPARGRDFKFARQNWKPMLDKYNVDLVLNGHDHTYARGHVPVRTSENDTPELGTVYVTSVSGPKQYGLDRKQILAYKSQGYRSDKTAEQTQFFQVISIEDNTLSYVAYTVMGDEYDRATITKDFATGKKSLED